MAQTTALSSLGTATAIILDPKLKTTTVQVTVASGSSGSNIFVQYTLDDPTTTPAPTVTWANLSSAIVSSNADGGNGGIGALYTVLSPLGGLRLASTTTVTGTVTLKTLQSVSG